MSTSRKEISQIPDINCGTAFETNAVLFAYPWKLAEKWQLNLDNWLLSQIELKIMQTCKHLRLSTHV